MIFANRTAAGQQLADRLQQYAGRADVLVLALPRGGVPVGFEIARTLRVPLDVFLVRKLGVPDHRELAMGAIASGGIRVINQDIVQALGIPDDAIESVATEEEEELERRQQAYRDDRPPPDLLGKTVILVDDGLATGSTMRAAVAAVRQQTPARIVVALPVGALASVEELRDEVDEVVCLLTPEPFHAVGGWYQDFSQTTDEEIRALLDEAEEMNHESPGAGEPQPNQ